MHSVTSNAVRNALPKIKIVEKTINYDDDYVYRIVPTDINLTTFDNVAVFVQAKDWSYMADIQSQSSNQIVIRVWKLNSITNSTVSLMKDTAILFLITAIYY